LTLTFIFLYIYIFQSIVQPVEVIFLKFIINHPAKKEDKDSNHFACKQNLI
jgi:hypothetical protein